MLLIFYLLISILLIEEANTIYLLFPSSSVLQITSCMTAPVILPGRKLYWDWGLQMNYDLPYNLAEFYNTPIWVSKWQDDERKHKRSLNESDINQRTNIYYDDDDKDAREGRHPSDFTAGELYYSFENLLTSYGFHETCLLRSVCELARHPFAENPQNIITETLTFLLTPSLHQGFSEAETVYREVYEDAERSGFLNRDCSLVYQECEVDFINAISSVITKK